MTANESAVEDRAIFAVPAKLSLLLLLVFTLYSGQEAGSDNPQGCNAHIEGQCHLVTQHIISPSAKSERQLVRMCSVHNQQLKVRTSDGNPCGDWKGWILHVKHIFHGEVATLFVSITGA